jgi:hypothetical protein
MYDTEDADIGVGECPICGQYRKQIDAGELKPCYMWDRIKEAKDEQQG